MEELPRRWQNLETFETKRRKYSRREGKPQEVFPVSLGKTGRQLEREKLPGNFMKETLSLPESLVGSSWVHICPESPLRAVQSLPWHERLSHQKFQLSFCMILPIFSLKRNFLAQKSVSASGCQEGDQEQPFLLGAGTFWSSLLASCLWCLTGNVNTGLTTSGRGKATLNLRFKSYTLMLIQL